MSDQSSTLQQSSSEPPISPPVSSNHDVVIEVTAIPDTEINGNDTQSFPTEEPTTNNEDAEISDTLVSTEITETNAATASSPPPSSPAVDTDTVDTAVEAAVITTAPIHVAAAVTPAVASSSTSTISVSTVTITAPPIATVRPQTAAERRILLPTPRAASPHCKSPRFQMPMQQYYPFDSSGGGGMGGGSYMMPYHHAPPQFVPFADVTVPPPPLDFPYLATPMSIMGNGPMLPNATVSDPRYSSQLESWYASFNNYEQQMNAYFEACSSKLHEWHKSGRGESPEYSKEYQKLMHDYASFMQYMDEMQACYQQQKQFTAVSSSPSLGPVGGGGTSELSAAMMNFKPPDFQPPPPVPDVSDAKVYSQYYKNMIKYYQKLLDDADSQEQKKSLASASSLNKNQKKKQRAMRAKKGKPNEMDKTETDELQIMAQYRESFGQQFDWASWHSYLSNMSRTNPQWYFEFKQQSKLKDIDWDRMYNDWAHSQGVTPVIFPQSSDHTVVGSDNAAESDNDEEEDDEDDDDDWQFCALCDQHFTHEVAFTRHLRGMIHTQRALESKTRKKPEEYAEEIQKEQKVVEEEITPEEKHMQWVMEQSRTHKTKGLGLKGSFYCTLCSVEVTSEKALEFHLNGRKHLGNLETLKQTGERPVLEPKAETKKPSVRIQPILDQCVDALIGLNYVTEYQRDDPNADCRYYCELCDARLTLKGVMSHLTGMKHRRAYMKFNYPDLYEILDHDNGVRDARKRRMEIFAIKIEEHEGRKKMSIKKEITNEILKDQKRKEVILKNREVVAKEKRLAREVAIKKKQEMREKKLQRAKEREIRHRKKAIAYIHEERQRRLATGVSECEIGDLEEGEIPSDMEEQYEPPENLIVETMKQIPMSEKSDSEPDFHLPVDLLYEEEDDEDIDETKEEEDVCDELELAEFEEVYSAAKQPLAVNIAEDPDRDCFIRRIRKKKLFKLKEVNEKSELHFRMEAEWALERAKNMEEMRKKINTKKAAQENHHFDDLPYMLPNLPVHMGPRLPPVFYPPPPRMFHTMLPPHFPRLRTNLSIASINQQIQFTTGRPRMPPPLAGQKRGLLPTPAVVPEKQPCLHLTPMEEQQESVSTAPPPPPPPPPSSSSSAVVNELNGDTNSS